MNTKILNVISETDSKFGSALESVFASMVIAENEIEKHQHQYPAKAKDIYYAFKYLMPPDLIVGKSDVLYRHFCHEIIMRIINGEKVDLPTRTEAFALIMETTWRGPLTSDYAMAAYILFGEIFPTDLVTKIFETDPFNESYPGAAEEAISYAIRRCPARNKL